MEAVRLLVLLRAMYASWVEHYSGVSRDSTTLQHRAQTSARTTIANFILDFEKLGTIYNCNTYTIARQSQQNPSPFFNYASA